ncbi:MAG: hypothetical protein IJ193_05195, partial [Bacilli bacterium]|nr:hypothetical protein [Bacilli bacterium]
MKKINRVLFIFIFFLFHISFLLIFLVSPKENFSEYENRYFEKLHFRTFSTYVSDHFPFRNSLLSIHNHFQALLGKKNLNGIYLGKDDYLIPEFKPNNATDYTVRIIDDFQKKNGNVDLMLVPDSILINESKLGFSPLENESKYIHEIYSKLNTNSIDLTSDFMELNTYEPLYYKTHHHW